MSMLHTVVVVVAVLVVAMAAKDGKLGGKTRSLIYKSGGGTLFEQYVTMKNMFVKATAEHRELVVVYGSDEKNGAGGYNLCDIFTLPSEVRCEKHMKMKCPKDETKKKDKADGKEDKHNPQKKKALYECDPSPTYENVEQVAQAAFLFPLEFPLQLQDKRREEVQYVQSMLGAVKPHSSKVVDYTVLYWGDAYLHLGRELGTCSAATAATTGENAACREFKQAATALVETSRPYCQPSAAACYVAGAAAATAQEAAILLDLGLQSFRGMWLQHQAKQQQDASSGNGNGSRGKAVAGQAQLSSLPASKLEAMLVHIAPASVEVMEWGLVQDAATFVALTAGASVSLPPSLAAASSGQKLEGAASAQAPALVPGAAGGTGRQRSAGGVLVLTSLAEFERARAGKTYCTTHRAGLLSSPGAAAATDPTWCGSIQAGGYKVTDFLLTSNTGGETDDGPFESAALNKVVVGLALTLMHVFSSRVLQLGLGGICVMLLIGVTRLCYVRWKRTSTKTF